MLFQSCDDLICDTCNIQTSKQYMCGQCVMIKRYKKLFKYVFVCQQIVSKLKSSLQNGKKHFLTFLLFTSLICNHFYSRFSRFIQYINVMKGLQPKITKQFLNSSASHVTLLTLRQLIIPRKQTFKGGVQKSPCLSIFLVSAISP